MSAFSVASQARYTRLFKRFGSDGTSTELQIIKTTGQVEDLVNLTRSAGTPVTTNLIGMISRFEEDIFAGTRVELGDILVNIDSTIVPETKDTIVIDSDNYTIMGIREVKTNQVVIGYQVHVRK